MKTLKALKITSIVNGIYCFMCTLFTFCLIINQNYSSSFVKIIGVISTFGFIINPTIVCFTVCLVMFLIERKQTEHRKLMGKKFVWIFIWPIITTLFYFLAISFLVVITGGV